MHPLLLVRVQEPGRLAVVVAELEDCRARVDEGCGCGGDVCGCGCAGGYGYGGCRGEELVLVERLRVGSGDEGGGGEGARGAGLDPALVVVVVPVQDDGEAAGYA